MGRSTLVVAVIAWGALMLGAVAWGFGMFPTCTATTCDAASMNGGRLSMLVLSGLVVVTTGAYLRFMPGSRS